MAMGEAEQWIRRGLHGVEAGSVATLLRALFAESPDPIAISRGTTVEVVNSALLKMFGYGDESEVAGKSVFDFIAADGREAAAEFVRRHAMGEGFGGVYVTRGLRRDGSEFPLQVCTTMYLLDGEAQTLAILRELDEHTGTHVLQRGDGFYRALFEVNTAIKLLIEPATGRIIDANQAAATFYGWPLDELRRMKISDINTLTPGEVQAEMDNARTGRRRYFRFRHRTARGEVRHVEVHSGPVELDGEQLLLSIIHDMTDRDELEDRLLESRRLEAVGRLAGGIAHDFNNLLTVIISSTEMMRKIAPSSQALNPYLQDITYAARRAADLTRELLAVGRRQLMKPENLELNDVVSQMQGMLQRTLGQQVIVRTELAPELPAVRADLHQMEQVLMNLALNAGDAMVDGGTLTLRTGVSSISWLDASPVPPGRWVTLTVADEGHGMDAETRRRIFEPFFTTKPAGSGTGLGLATVHGIVAQTGGHLTVKSELGLGSEFVVFLPTA